MHILIDMDSTIADWGQRYDMDLDVISAYCLELDDGDCVCSIPRTSSQKAFNLHEGMSPGQSAIIRRIMDRPGFYADLEPIEGAIDALHKMLADGHEVSIVTSPWLSNPTCVQDKLNWVKENLGDGWEDRVIITKDKTLIDGDILIDDRPDINGKATPKWTHILFDQPYNEKITDRIRLVRWANWEASIQAVAYDKWEAASTLGAETRTISATGGEKGTKPQDYSLMPVLPMNLLAELYHNGAVKYSSHNWRKGYEWSKSYAAAMRHMTSFWDGEDLDPEMGLPHVTSAVFHMFALAQFMTDYPEFDDRYKK